MSEKKVGKRLLTWVLVLVMTLSLLPLNVLADVIPETDGGAAATDDKLHFTKEATLDQETGEITVRMEAWATGEVTTSTSTEALDIALVLDVSGSMKEDFIQEESKFVPVYNLDNNETYYVKGAFGLYHEVTWCEKCGKWTRGCVSVLGLHLSLGKYVAKTSETDSNRDHEQLYEYYYSAGQSKIDALKKAVNSFIDDVAKKSPDSQIAIVKFAGTKSDNVGNHMYNGYNYTQIVEPLTKVDTNGVTSLQEAVNALNYGGATSADYGMEKAQEALRDADTSHKKVVVLFTDGEPNHQNGFDYSVAAATINTAKEMKTDTTIYTIGVFREQDDNVDTYMSSTSSNHPGASATTLKRSPYWTVTDGGSDLGDYYKKVNNADDLLKAFEKISSEVTPGTALGSTAVLTDVIAPNCSLVVPEGTSGITAYTVDKTADGWSTTSTLLEGNAVTVIGQEVQVIGFDYSANCVTTTPKPGTTDNYGKKLVVEFKVQNNNYGGTQPTNSDAFISDGNSTRVKEADRPRPEVAVPVKLPEQVATYADSKVYDGEGYDIKANIAGLVAGLVPVDGTNNKYIDLTYEIKDSNGNIVGTYTISHNQTTGTWADDTSDIKTSADVGEYTYTVTVTGTDSSLSTNSASKDYTAKFNITARPLEITANSASKDYDGQKLTLTARDYTLTNNTSLAIGDTIESVTVSGEVGPNAGSENSTISDAVIKRGDTDVTANYAITYKPGTLTITDSTSTVTVTFKIDGGTWADGGTTDKTAQVTLTNGTGTLAGVTIPAGMADSDHEGAGVWKDASGNEVTLSETTEITGDTTYMLTFKAKEVKPTYVDVTVNYYKDSVTTENLLATETLTGQAVKSQITLTSEQLDAKKPTTGGYMSGVQQGTVPYTVGEKDNVINVLYTKEIKPDTVLGVLNQYVKKQFNSTYGYSTTAEFTVDATVTKNGPVIINASEGQIAAQELSPVSTTYTGKVTLSTGASELFVFSGTDTPLEASTHYQVTVKERDANLSYVTCDTAEYRFNFITDANCKVNNIQGVTITNTYYYKHTYRPPTPTVVIPDDDALGLNTTDHFAYIIGYGNGEVRPQNNITRAEVATIFFRLLTDDVRDENLTKTNRYSDVAATSWYNTAVSTLSSMGIITGYPDGTFRPNAAITRAEFAAIAARFDNDGDKTAAKFSDIATHWARDEISIAYNNGWITGYPDGTFGPQRDITRAETMTLVNRVLNRQPETEDDLLPNMTVWTDNANPKAWYYLAVQEATNSHYYKFKTNSKYEKWTELRETRDWTQLEK